MIWAAKRAEKLGGEGVRQAFALARREGRAAFVPFLVAGDPDLPRSLLRLQALAAVGADLLEVGIPFSDPIADGPVIQAASERALRAGTSVEEVLSLVAQLRQTSVSVPVVLFSYFNPILRYGLPRFAAHAKASGADGVLVVDLPPEEARGEYLDALRAEGLAPIFLLAPTSPKARMDLVREMVEGFVYYVSRTGTTGEREDLRRAVASEVRSVRRRVRLPVALGFGVSTPEQVAAAAAVADGVVVGSALVRVAQEKGLSGLEAFARSLRAATRR
jgi:tryptophan synthase alpha chain